MTTGGAWICAVSPNGRKLRSRGSWGQGSIALPGIHCCPYRSSAHKFGAICVRILKVGESGTTHRICMQAIEKPILSAAANNIEIGDIRLSLPNRGPDLSEPR